MTKTGDYTQNPLQGQDECNGDFSPAIPKGTDCAEASEPIACIAWTRNKANRTEVRSRDPIPSSASPSVTQDGLHLSSPSPSSYFASTLPVTGVPSSTRWRLERQLGLPLYLRSQLPLTGRSEVEVNERNGDLRQLLEGNCNERAGLFFFLLFVAEQGLQFVAFCVELPDPIPVRANANRVNG